MGLSIRRDIMGVRGLVLSWAVFFLMGSVNSFGDTIKLKSGGELQGIVEEKENEITIETGYGTATFKREEVLSIDYNTKSNLEVYYEKYNKIKDSKNADDFYELAEWAKKNKVTKFLSELYKRTIELSPNHLGARTSLGYILFNDKWLTKNEYMKVKGFVLFKGKWMTPAEKELIEQEEKEKKLKETIAKEEAKLKQEKEEEEKRQKQEEENTARQNDKDIPPSNPFDLNRNYTDWNNYYHGYYYGYPNYPGYYFYYPNYPGYYYINRNYYWYSNSWLRFHIQRQHWSLDMKF